MKEAANSQSVEEARIAVISSSWHGFTKHRRAVDALITVVRAEEHAKHEADLATSRRTFIGYREAITRALAAEAALGTYAALLEAARNVRTTYDTHGRYPTITSLNALSAALRAFDDASRIDAVGGAAFAAPTSGKSSRVLP